MYTLTIFISILEAPYKLNIMAMIRVKLLWLESFDLAPNIEMEINHWKKSNHLRKTGDLFSLSVLQIKPVYSLHLTHMIRTCYKKKSRRAKLICIILQKIALFSNMTLHYFATWLYTILQNFALLRKTLCNITQTSLCIIKKRHFAILLKITLHYFAKKMHALFRKTLCIILQISLGIIT